MGSSLARIAEAAVSLCLVNGLLKGFDESVTIVAVERGMNRNLIPKRRSG